MIRISNKIEWFAVNKQKFARVIQKQFLQVITQHYFKLPAHIQLIQNTISKIPGMMNKVKKVFFRQHI